MHVEKSTFILVKKIKSHKWDYRVSNFNAKFKHFLDCFKEDVAPIYTSVGINQG